MIGDNNLQLSSLSVAVCQLPQQVPHGAGQDQPQLSQVLHLHLHGGGHPGELDQGEDGQEAVPSQDLY